MSGAASMVSTDTLGLLGAVVGSGIVGSFLRGWWLARQAQRADAVDSANARANVSMLEQAQAERQAALVRLAAAEAEVKVLAGQVTQLTVAGAAVANKLEVTEGKLRRALAALPPEKAELIETRPAPLT